MKPLAAPVGLVAVVDFALFQLAWFACATQAAQGRPALGIAAVAAFVAWQWARSDRRQAEAMLVVIALALGLAWDTALLQSGLVRYAAPGPLPGVAPAWILAMWALLAAVLRGPLRWLRGRPWLAAALGAVGGPASYAAAARLGACELAGGMAALGVLGLGWALLTPLLLEAARRLDTGPAAAGVVR
jgi:hypothetical protein